MRTLAAIFLAAAATAFPATALAGPGPFDTCQAEPCTDPVGHFTKPAQPIIDALGVDPRP
jgi:hypothetical protein